MSVDVKALKRTGKGAPPKPVETHNNLEKPPASKTVPLQVNIPPDVRREYRMYAASHDTDLSKLFVSMFDYYRENHG